MAVTGPSSALWLSPQAQKPLPPGLRQRYMRRMSPTPRSARLLVLAAILLWSTAGVLIKATDLGPWVISGARSLIAAALVWGLTRRDGAAMTRLSHLAALLYAVLLTCFVLAATRTTAAHAILLQYTAPLHVLLLGAWLLGERLRAREVVTILACSAGLSLLLLDPAPQDHLPERDLGNVFALISGFCLGCYFVLLKHPEAQTPNPAATVVWGNLWVVVLTAPFILAAPPSVVTGADVAVIAALGVLQIGLAYWLFALGMRRGARPAEAAALGFIEPVLNPIWVYLVHGERPSSMALAGGAVILAALGLQTLFAARGGAGPRG
jgi:DME family drug/metabolite transporter